MERRVLLGVVVGAAFGWAAATYAGSPHIRLFPGAGGTGGASDEDGSGESGGDGGGADDRASPTTGATAEGPSSTPADPTGESTPSPPATAEGGEAPSPDRSDRTATEDSSPTATDPAGESTPDLRGNVDVYSNSNGAHADPNEPVYVNYVIRNDHEFAVDATFEGTLTLGGGDTLRRRRTARIEAGGVASDSLVFDEYEGRATGWSFSLLSVDRA
ncbi:hypothetical protein [Halegenticoccus soli]|uniref:hypothetical protein n=1 Tax=Halegenticoccus soli TaxID=1985678 RepID=UPI000C6D49CC|nr:hypothetical protein [Halegenticoccus soli]